MKRALETVAFALELAALGVVLWRYLRPEGPPLSELAGEAWSSALERAQYQEAIRRTFASIRNLPETEPDA